MIKRTKYIFFDTIEAAERFKTLYDDKHNWVTINTLEHDYFIRSYFGHNSLGKVQVYFRTDTENIEKISKAIGLKKCKWAGHLCYYYKG